jgi:hypothetical protein
MGSRFGNNVLLLALVFLCCAGYTRDYIYAFKPTKPIQDINEIYESSVWVHFTTTNDGGTTFAGTGWAVAYDENLGVTFISTAGHVVDHDAGTVRVYYWLKNGDWKITAGVVFYSANRENGDIAIIAIPVKIPTLPVATKEEYNINDEVILAGVQHQAPPALVSIGVIKKITTTKIYIDAWSWRGHSGGPLIHRKTNRVIGFVTAFGSDDTTNASFTVCSNFRVIGIALHKAGIQ